jgi:hypothetical protein
MVKRKIHTNKIHKRIDPSLCMVCPSNQENLYQTTRGIASDTYPGRLQYKINGLYTKIIVDNCEIMLDKLSKSDSIGTMESKQTKKEGHTMKKLTKIEAVQTWFSNNNPQFGLCDCGNGKKQVLTVNGICLDCTIDCLVTNFHNTDVEYCEDCGSLILDTEDATFVESDREDFDGWFYCDNCL